MKKYLKWIGGAIVAYLILANLFFALGGTISITTTSGGTQTFEFPLYWD